MHSTRISRARGVAAVLDESILRARDLTTRFYTESGQVNAVENVSFTLREGETLGIVGESGSGKSVTALSMIGLVESPGRVVSGELWYRNPTLAEGIRDDRPEAVDGEFVGVLQLPEETRNRLRGSAFSMVFQDPLNSFNPTLTVGEQIAEAVEVQRRGQRGSRSYSLGSFVLDSIVPTKQFVSAESRDRAIELLESVGLSDPAERADQYPHQFSGGMLQRAMIAQALAGQPDVLLADELTTALDVTIQAQILRLLQELQEEWGLSVVLITHDLGVVARISDRVVVMYAGEVAERGTLADVFRDPVHPYTRGLLGSIPDLDDPRERLQPIEGNVPDLIDAEMGDACYFADRCPKAMSHCMEKPPEFRIDDQHGAKCYLADMEYDPDRAIDRTTNGGEE